MSFIIDLIGSEIEPLGMRVALCRAGNKIIKETEAKCSAFFFFFLYFYFFLHLSNNPALPSLPTVMLKGKPRLKGSAHNIIA